MANKTVLIALLVIACVAVQNPYRKVFASNNFLQDFTVEQNSNAITAWITNDVLIGKATVDDAISNILDMCADGTLIQSDCDSMLPMYYDMKAQGQLSGPYTPSTKA